MERFERLDRQSGGLWKPNLQVWVDRETGVQYLIAMNGSQSAGITVLVDRNGTPLVAKEDDRA